MRTWTMWAAGSGWRMLAATAAVAGVGCAPAMEPQDVGEPNPVIEQGDAITGNNLAGANLAGVNLAGVNLAGTNLAGANLGGNNLAGNNLAGNNLAGTNLAGNNLAGSNLAGSNLAGSNLAGNNLSGNNLAGNNLAGNNLAGMNLAGSNLAGSNLAGLNLAGNNLAGNNLAGNNLAGNNLAGNNSGVNIHGLTIASNANGMLWSAEDQWKPDGTNSAQCVVMGIGSTAFSKLLSQQSANAKISVALGKLSWGFANTSGGSKALDAWEAIVWGDKTYCSFVLAVPTATPWSGVAGFIKGVFRWQAPTTQSMDISGIDASSQFDTTVQTTITTYTGMMDAAAKYRAGTITANDFVAGELGFVTATTNNQSVSVDFSSWVRQVPAQSGLVLGNVSNSPPPTYSESVYMVVDKGNGLFGIIINDPTWFAPGGNTQGIIPMITDLNTAQSAFENGLTPNPVPTRCDGALYMQKKYGGTYKSGAYASLYPDPTGPGGKCDSGLMWQGGAVNGQSGCVMSAINWTGVAGTTAPFNTWMARTGSSSTPYKQGLDCNTLWPVVSETYIHMWGPAFAYPAGSFDDSSQGARIGQFNYSGSWTHATASSAFKSTYSKSSTTNNYVSFIFSGTQAKLYGVKDPSHGIGAVSIDGGSESNVDFYGSSQSGNQLLWTSATLTSGNHTLKVRVTGTKSASSTGYNVAPDRVDTVVSGGSCTPTTCAAAGKNCGSISDGCSGTLTCGSCTSPQTCGGGGTANVCGSSSSTCSAAYSSSNCVGYTTGTRVSSGGHNWTCANGNCMNCATYTSCAPGGSGCPWGTVWTDNGTCQ